MDTEENVRDLYKILGLDRDVGLTSNCEELISNAYRTKAKICHPDKYKNKSVEKQKTMEDMFNLLTMSYKILIDPVKRREYDVKLKKNYDNVENDYCGLKKQFIQQKPNVPETEVSSEYSQEFKEKFKELDKKIVSDDVLFEHMDREQALKKVRKLTESRIEQERNIIPERILNDNNFNNNIFNAVFEKINKKPINDTLVPFQYDPYASLTNSSMTFAGIDQTGLFTEDNQDSFLGKDVDEKYKIDHDILDSIIQEEMNKEMNKEMNVEEDKSKNNKIVRDKLKKIMNENSELMNIPKEQYLVDEYAGYGILNKIGHVERLELN